MSKTAVLAATDGALPPGTLRSSPDPAGSWSRRWDDRTLAGTVRNWKLAGTVRNWGVSKIIKNWTVSGTIRNLLHILERLAGTGSHDRGKSLLINDDISPRTCDIKCWSEIELTIQKQT